MSLGLSGSLITSWDPRKAETKVSLSNLPVLDIVFSNRDNTRNRGRCKYLEKTKYCLPDPNPPSRTRNIVHPPSECERPSEIVTYVTIDVTTDRKKGQTRFVC